MEHKQIKKIKKNAPAKDAVGLLEVLHFEIFFSEHAATCPAHGNRCVRHHHLEVSILASVVPCCDTGKGGREGGRGEGRRGRGRGGGGREGSSEGGREGGREGGEVGGISEIPVSDEFEGHIRTRSLRVGGQRMSVSVGPCMCL
jgi:hypothetical protein